MIQNIKYLFPFLLSFATSVLAIFFLLRAGSHPKAKLSNFLKLSFRKRLGGVVVILVFIFLVLLNRDLVITKPIAGILAGAILILLLGLWDDLKNLNWKWQLLFQITIALVAISFGVKSDYVTNPFGGIIYLTSPLLYTILYTLYIILFVNSLNWLDGVDGLAGSVTFTALAVIFFLSLAPHVNQPAVAILAAAAGGIILGFLVFNWHPAKILAGTSGAWFFGFVLASLSIFAGAKIATVLMATLIPMLDFFRVIYERWRDGRSIFSRDDRHLHFKLLKLGLSERQVAFFVAAVSVVIGVAALHLNAIGKMIFVSVFALTYFTFVSLLNVKFKNQNAK